MYDRIFAIIIQSCQWLVVKGKGEMQILVATQGPYGERILKHLKACSPSGWSITAITLPPSLPLVIDDPVEFLPSNIPQAELLIAMVESDAGAQLIPELARLCGVKAAIVPVDNPAWLPLGLQNQIEQELNRAGVSVVFPKTFCTLTETGTGYRRKIRPYSDKLIAAFAQHFGRPRLHLTIDPVNRKITSVTVERGSPCGSTHHTAQRLVGMDASDVVPKAGLFVHQFPCLASMQEDEIDTGILEPLMVISGYVMNEEAEQKTKSAVD